MLTKDTITQYGWVSKFLHWTLAILVIFQVYTALWTIYVLPKDSPEAGFYIGLLHKPLGMLTAIFAILSIIWYLINIRPIFPLSMPSWEKVTARIVHPLLLLGILIMALSGLIFTTAAGRPPNFYGLFQVPQFITVDKAISELFFNIHEISAYILIGLVVLHTLAALKHHFIDKDNVLKRML